MYKSIFLTILLILLSVSTFGAKGKDAERADQFINQGEQAAGEGQYAKAIPLFTQAADYAEKARNPYLQALAIYDVGVCYYTLYETGEAQKHFYDALTILNDQPTTPKVRELITKINNAVAGVYFQGEHYDKAQQLALQCYQNALANKDKGSIATYALDLALIANKQGRYEETDKYIAIVRESADSTDENHIKSYAIEAETRYLQHRYDDVERIAQYLMSKSEARNTDRGVVLTYLIDIYGKRGQYAQAIALLPQSRRETGLSNLPFLYQTVADVYRKQGHLEQAMLMTDSVTIYSDSLQKIRNLQLTEATRVKIEVMKAQMLMQQQMNSLTQQRRVLILTILVCVLFIAVAITAWRNNKTEKKLAQQQARETELAASYQKQLLSQSLLQKSQSLSTTTMLIASRDQLLQQLLEILQQLQNEPDPQLLADVTTDLRHIISSNKQQDDFLLNFQEANPQFVNQLTSRHPELTDSDVRFLSYIRMRLTDAEIGNMLNINAASCKRRKIRLSKKMGFKTVREFCNYIQTL